MKLYNGSTHEQIALPALLIDFRNKIHTVQGISRDSEPGKSGKVYTAEGREFYPSVFFCYIADNPKEDA